MVKIKGKIWKHGNSYALTVQKALIDADVLKEGSIYEFTLVEKQNAVYGAWPPEAVRFSATTGRIAEIPS